MKPGILACCIFAAAFAAQANQTHHQPSPYAGEESREIKSLSADDLEELKRGGGWGLAKAAELNGVPGPAHLLELRDEIRLSSGQVDEITRVFEAMRARAIEQGEGLISLERELEQQFRQGTVTAETLRGLLRQIADVRAELRYVHLSAHLEMDRILTAEQVSEYNRLRGYTLADPCEQVPRGHDPAMWRKHNGCG
jgi:hypothetical protein